MARKEEIAQNEQFHLFSPCSQLYSIIVFSFKRDVPCFCLDVFQSRLLQMCCMWENIIRRTFMNRGVQCARSVIEQGRFPTLVMISHQGCKQIVTKISLLSDAVRGYLYVQSLTT